MAQVSIVIVSHSAKMGQGLVDLLRQLVGQDVHLESAAGFGEDIGTDATYIMKKIQACPADTDVLVFFDLGSALMNTEMALDLMPDAIRQRVHIVDAPLVEGAVAAAVQARGNFAPGEVITSAMQAKGMDKILK